MPRFLADFREHVDEAGPAADGFDRQAAPELELAVDLERLPAVDRDEADALLAHPVERVEALRDQELDQVGIGAVLRHLRHVVEEFLGGVGAEVGLLDLLLGEVRDQRLDVVDAVIDHADRSGGEAAVTAGLVLWRRFQHHDLRALLLRRQRRAERRIAAAHHDHVVLSHRFHPLRHPFRHPEVAAKRPSKDARALSGPPSFEARYARTSG